MNVEIAGSGPALLLLHGFTGSTATWEPYLAQFAEGRRAISIDLIGHGETDSPPEADRYTMERAVSDLLAVLDAADVPWADVLGYSLGGRVALHLATQAPWRVRSLVLESASPGLTAPDERQARIADDESLARRIEREGVEAFIDFWETIPLFASQARLPEAVRVHHRSQRLRNSPIGLANSLRGMGTGRQEPLWDSLPHVGSPTLVLAGALDEKYCAVSAAMASRLPRSELVIAPEAGHAVHLEAMELFGRTVLDFLSAQATEPVRAVSGLSSASDHGRIL